jgi:hypothetical protein
MLIVGIIAIVYRLGFMGGGASPGPENGTPTDDCNWTERHPVNELAYVSHAKCRMKCRDIDQTLVEKIYLHGEINCEKSSIKAGNHRYALEASDDRGDRIRIIVEDDHGKHLIITVIRLDKEDRCTCS